MPEPEINTLQHDSNPLLDKVCTLSDTGPVPATASKLAIIRPAAGAPPAKPAETKRKKRKKPAPQFLQAEEIARLFKAIDAAPITNSQRIRDRAIFRIAYHAGLRASEVGMLDMRDYDSRTDRLSVTRLKNSNSGQHPLAKEETRALRAWLKERGNAPGAIFLSRRGQPISRKMLDVLMKDYGETAGIPPKLRHFHVLKHSCATHLLDRGFNVELVQDWLGHADIRNTMIYAKVSNRRRDEMARALQDWK